ncbi:MAG: lysylphosphatidylglycerol synthase transmembrane domain-containing protein [Planctomycetota bacterium]
MSHQPPAAGNDPAVPASRRRRFLAVLRIGLGAAILAYVAWRLPWRDQVSWRAPDGSELAAPGAIDGDWKGDAVRFRADPAVLADPRWPADLAAAARAEQSLAIARRGREELASGYDWKPSMVRVFREMEARGIAAGMGLISLGLLLGITRWWRLLALSGCRTSWGHALRLTFLGCFYNLVVPGLTGGDLVKGVIAAKENPGRRADAIVSIVVDRLLGMAALALLAMVAILAAGDTFAALRPPLLGILAGGAGGALLYANRTLRRRLRISALVDRLPLGDKLRALDRAAVLYLRHPFEVAFAVLLSLGNHLCIVFGVLAFGLAFGIDAGPAAAGAREYLVVVPVANAISAVPLTPGGWGLGEAVYQGLFERIGASGTLGVAVSVTFRLSQVALGLVGGILQLGPGGRAPRGSPDAPRG